MLKWWCDMIITHRESAPFSVGSTVFALHITFLVCYVIVSQQAKSCFLRVPFRLKRYFFI